MAQTFVHKMRTVSTCRGHTTVHAKPAMSVTVTSATGCAIYQTSFAPRRIVVSPTPNVVMAPILVAKDQTRWDAVCVVMMNTAAFPTSGVLQGQTFVTEKMTAETCGMSQVVVFVRRMKSRVVMAHAYSHTECAMASQTAPMKKMNCPAKVTVPSLIEFV